MFALRIHSTFPFLSHCFVSSMTLLLLVFQYNSVWKLVHVREASRFLTPNGPVLVSLTCNQSKVQPASWQLEDCKLQSSGPKDRILLWM